MGWEATMRPSLTMSLHYTTPNKWRPCQDCVRLAPVLLSEYDISKPSHDPNDKPTDRKKETMPSWLYLGWPNVARYWSINKEGPGRNRSTSWRLLLLLSTSLSAHTGPSSPLLSSSINFHYKVNLKQTESQTSPQTTLATDNLSKQFCCGAACVDCGLLEVNRLEIK